MYLNIFEMIDLVHSLLAYQSSSRYVGLLELPVQQHRSTAIIGHGERIAHLLAAHDGKYLLTCDSRYHCLNLWRVDAERFRQTVQASATMHAYSDADLAIVRDYLAYAMLEDSAVANNVGEEITARHVVTVMRALGYFPSNADIVDIERELCYTQEPRAVLLEAPPTPDMLTFTIDVHMFVTLLVNHRPVNDDVTLATIGSALDALTEGQERERVIAALGSVGEIMKTEELVTCLKAIRPDLEPDSLPDTANAETFMDAWLDLGDQMKI
uniref:Uncharacterized protein n=1 Tax=Spongospora subterranea TaxID=70186 RepID=A0A0H5QIL5_9EUKA|eukprot:CRZ01920.1 hypothetical protein [Spongospora subterranea]